MKRHKDLLIRRPLLFCAVISSKGVEGGGGDSSYIRVYTVYKIYYSDIYTTQRGTIPSEEKNVKTCGEKLKSDLQRMNSWSFFKAILRSSIVSMRIYCAYTRQAH